MRFSIIIPTLNEERYIGRLLDSLSRQSLKEFEVIVVDGKSSDRTVEKASGFKDRLDIKIVASDKRHVSHQRNLGVRNARNAHLIFMDADVVVGKRFIERSAKEFADKGASVAIPKYISQDRRWYYRLFFGSINTGFWVTQRWRPCGIGMCIFSTKKAHETAGGFDERMNFSEDLQYMRRAERKNFAVLGTDVMISVRRFEKEGTKKTMRKWFASYWHFLTGKLEKCNSIEYDMEGRR